MGRLDHGALLADPNYYGTLAAMRDLGRAGIPVVLANDDPHSTGSTSRFCTLQEHCGPTHAMAAFSSWLKAFGRRFPGLVLYPTSDDLAWLIASYQDDLKADFRLFQPPARSVLAVLDKSQLYFHAAVAGVPVPETHTPESMDQVRALGVALAKNAQFPLIVKPRTHCGARKKVKGSIVSTAEELEVRTTAFLSQHRFTDEFLASAPAGICWPIVQRFLPQARANTYSLSGFLDRSGKLRAARAAVKLFQEPAKIGVGVAFEGQRLLPALMQHVERLSAETGYFGVFEAEFIHVPDDDAYLLIDFNPRYYGQMHFDICRGMSLPRMVHAGAWHDSGKLDELVQHAQRTQVAEAAAASQRYCSRWKLRTLLWAERAKGSLSSCDHAFWRQWMDSGDMFDSVADTDDPAPLVRDKTNYLMQWVRHPRAMSRQLLA